jgi:4-oxalocrotonate tautomerase
MDAGVPVAVTRYNGMIHYFMRSKRNQPIARGASIDSSSQRRNSWSTEAIAESAVRRLQRKRSAARTLPSTHTRHEHQKENRMPFANYKFPQGLLNEKQKEEIIHKTTDMFASYFGENVRPYSMVLIDEVVDGGWGRADETLTLAKLGLKK